jgi:protein O-GlcNAc transferase
MSALNFLDALRSRFKSRAVTKATAAGGVVTDVLQQALDLLRQGKLEQAETLYLALLQQEADNVDALQFLGVVQAQRGRLNEAAKLMDRAIELAPDHATAHGNRGNVLRGLARHKEAVASYDRALVLDPENPDTLLNRAAAQVDLGKPEAALADYEAVLVINPDHRVARLRRCELLSTLQRYSEALAGYEAALQGVAEDADLLFHCGVLLVKMRRYAEAVARYDQALMLKPDYVEVLNNRGIALWNDRLHADAVTSYDRALAVRPDYADAHYNRGIALAGLNRHAEALASYDRAIVCHPGYARAHSNRGSALVRLEQLDAALASYDQALALNPRLTDALNNRGGLFRRMGLHERAAQDYARLLEFEPQYERAAGNQLYSEAWCCNWAGFYDSRANLLEAVSAGGHVALPFQIAVLSDSAEEHLACARSYVARRYPTTTKPLWTGERYRHDRIRIAYLSADFRDHATSQLMAELFERHDRERFEVSAWSFGPETGDAMRARLRSAFEHFHDVREISDDEVAAALRADEIDIAVDLKGFTDGCRPGIFAKRVAPIQVNYLGYPGTTGSDCMDYIIGDAEVIPEGHEAHYSEQVVRLPDSYQVNDTKRLIADHTPTRAEAGLPASGFVFCCFNNNYKITPEVFDVWMRLLKAVPGSVLWLLEDNAAASRNLRREAGARGVDAERLVFAGRVLPPAHLARQRLADLFLDNLPCNAHTTASDALWAGLPLLTCRGNAFAGRVAASLLRAVGLPELITDDLGAYEALALKLATTPGELAALKARLKQNRLTHPLFDIDRYRRHLESAYVTMIDQHRQGKPPQAFSVQALS